jgi:outer membrane protein insertion porin family
LSLLIVAILCIFPNRASSSETVRVVVLPFEIHALKDLSYMKDEISGVIKRQLEQDGAVLIDPGVISEDTQEKMAKGIDGIRSFGIESGADDVIWGSLTWIGDKFSLDAKMVYSFSGEPPDVFFVEGQGIENLLKTVKDIAQNISMKLFKREKIARVLFSGNKRIETDAIKRNIKTKPGDIYLVRSLTEDLKAIYSMGYFDDIRIEAEDGSEGKVITFNLKEKPAIRKILFKGNKAYKDEDIEESLNLKSGSTLNIFKVRRNIRRIEELYREKNYHNVKIDYQTKQLEKNQADLEFIIVEGEKVLIKHIIFEGNTAYNDKKLKKLMKTAEKGFFSWATSSGDLNLEDLDQDVATITAFYHNNGYIGAKVGDPIVEFKDTWIEITIKIDEGPQFRVGTVDITGDLVLPKEDLLEKLKIAKETYYNREVVRGDVLVLTDIYSDAGYAYARATPRIDENIDELYVNITYVIEKGKQVYFENIIIGGNEKTRDKVIRRELHVYEQELFSGKRLKRSIRNLYRLDFFEDIKVNTAKGSSDDTMILKIDVTEKATGTLSFGGGYSSVEDVFVSASINQRNLLGRGQILQVEGQIGDVTKKYIISFTEPWLYDIPLSAGFSLFKWSTDYDTYEKDSTGGSAKLSYPVFDFSRFYLTYSYEKADIINVSEFASKSVKDLEGENITSSITTLIRYDSRDRQFNPTEGSRHSLSVEYAGLGGNIGFTKLIAGTGWYIPLIKDTVGFLNGKIGFVRENSNGILPDYEKFYLGGMNSVRGFGWRDIFLLDEDGAEVGGEKFVQFNVELLIPLLKDAGLVGVLFFDTGNVYGKDDSIDLGNMRESIGYGIRWFSPMGPIRLEYGYVLDEQEGEDTGGWEFAIGAAF